MKTTVNEYDFRRAFKEANRENNFTPYALGKLFDYLEYYEEETGEEIELDVIDLCCGFAEFESFEELKQNYDVPKDKAKAQKYLEERTQVISFEENCILIQRY